MLILFDSITVLYLFITSVGVKYSPSKVEGVCLDDVGIYINCLIYKTYN